MRSVRKDMGGLGNLLFKEAYIYAQLRRGEIPDLYLQSPKYWAEYGEEIRQRFGSGIKRSDYVSLHIRLGDYVNNEFYVNLLETDYYQKAVKVFSPDTEFLVFCADRQNRLTDIIDSADAQEFVKSLGVKYKMHDHQDEAVDLNTMAGCTGHIMANSSFSWWASFLGGGVTIAPRQWFTDTVHRIDLLDDWIKI